MKLKKFAALFIAAAMSVGTLSAAEILLKSSLTTDAKRHITISIIYGFCAQRSNIGLEIIVTKPVFVIAVGNTIMAPSVSRKFQSMYLAKLSIRQHLNSSMAPAAIMVEVIKGTT